MAGGMHVWQGVAYMVGDAWQGGMCSRGHVWQGPCMAGVMATAVGSTHPTGMHSCFI